MRKTENIYEIIEAIKNGDCYDEDGELIDAYNIASYEKDEFYIDDSEKTEIEQVKEIIKTGYIRNKETKVAIMILAVDFKSVNSVYILDRWWRNKDFIKNFEPARIEQFFGTEI